MAFQTTREGSKFVVDFGTIPIPSAMAKELEGEFQRLALAILAKVDFRGDLHIGRLPTGIYGYVFEPNGFPPPDGKQDQAQLSVEAQLSVYDHTNIVRTLMERPLPVVRQFVAARKQGEGKPPKPSWDEVLEAILKLLGPPVSTRRTIETTLRIGKAIEGQPLPRSAKTAVEKINKQIDFASDIDDLIDTLKRAQRADEGTVEGLGTGLRIAQQILEDGRGTIYSPDFGFYKDFGDPLVAYSVAKEDAKGAVGGAVAGGMAGAAVGGVGAGPGAITGGLAGGAGASVAEAVGQLIDWLF